jgi:spore germination protein
MSLTGCGSSGRTQTIFVELPGYARASSPIGHVAASGRRVSAHAVNRGRASQSPPPQTGAGAAVAPPTPQITPLTAKADARLNGVSVWIPYWGLGAAVPSAIDNANVVKVAHPFIYEISGTSDVIDQSGGEAPEVSRELAAAHLEVIPTVTETDSMAAFAAVLTNRKQEAAMLEALESIAEQPANDGIDLDFENLAYGSGSLKQAEEVATLYPSLVARLCAALHRSNRSCEVTVMAKNTPGKQDADGLSTFAYNYSALSHVADRIQIMAYDDHYSGGAAGPIAPWPWVQSVLKYALTQIPADKIVLGVPAYGYDWSSAGGATSVTATSAAQLASDEGAQILWDSADAEPYFTYSTRTTSLKKVPVFKLQKSSQIKRVTVKGVQSTETVTTTRKVKHEVTRRIVRETGHTVWFEDSTANYDRAVLAADDQLAGIAIWAGGDESPGLWSMLGRLSR